MRMSAFQLMSRMDLGKPMHLRRLQQSQRLQQSAEQRNKFDAHLRYEHIKADQKALISPGAKEDIVQGTYPSMAPGVKDNTGPIWHEPIPPVGEQKPAYIRPEPTPTPPAVEETPNQDGPPRTRFASEEERAAYRRGKMHGFMHMRRTNPGLHQTRMGWVITRLNKALGENPMMADKDIESLVDSLINNAPDYGVEE